MAKPSVRSRDTAGRYANEPGPIFVEGKHYRVDANGCWLWLGANSTGYGHSHRGKRLGLTTILAHRISYEFFVGPIPPGLQLDHLCQVKLCINPAHLEPVTRQVNILRGPVGKVTLAQREDIRSEMGALVEKYGVTARTLAAIYEDRSYRRRKD